MSRRPNVRSDAHGIAVADIRNPQAAPARRHRRLRSDTRANDSDDLERRGPGTLDSGGAGVFLRKFKVASSKFKDQSSKKQNTPAGAALSVLNFEH
jgi:hypothetical protein